jgi:hypothetical protein
MMDSLTATSMRKKKENNIEKRKEKDPETKAYMVPA